MGTSTATKAEIQPMDLSKTLSVFEQHDTSQQVSDEYVQAIRASILVGAEGETAAEQAFTRLISIADVITEGQKALLLTGLGKTSKTARRYAVIAEIITCGQVKPRALRTETWQMLRTAVNKADDANVIDEVVSTILAKANGKVISFGQVKNIIDEMVKATDVRTAIAPATALGGFIKTTESNIVKAHALHQEGVVMDDKAKASAERTYALLGVILGK